jgi:hypothetical protein
MAKKHIMKCLPSLVIMEMQIKTTLRFRLTPVRLATIMNTNNIKMLARMLGKKKLHILLVGM